MGAIIQRSFGGSALTAKSGGYIKVESGASLQVDSGAGLSLGGQLDIQSDATTTDTVYSALKMGNNTLWYMAGSAASPVFSASPGDMLWLANSASTSFWMNRSDGTSGSRWMELTFVDSTSEVPGAR